MNLKSPITTLPKVGPRYKSLLENLGVETIGDLLYHFPFRYEDFSQTKKISELVLNESATVRATLEKIDNIFTKYGKKLTKAVFSDETGKISVMWFNMHYLKKSLKVGETYVLSGKVGSSAGKLSFFTPVMEAADASGVNTGRLVPVYPETAGVSSKWLRTRISDILNSGLELAEFLPEKVMEERGFMGFETALRAIHFPEKLEDAVEAKRRFAYEELFLELLKVENRKSAWKKELKAQALKMDQKVVDELIKSLPFELSESQKTALEAIFSDLGSNHPMNRLLEGDVGSGKTVVAVVSAYLAHLNGLKILYMAPTEILAQQHYETFKNYLEPFGVKVALKTSASKTVNGANVIVGTHALIHMEEKIKNVGLIVIDEQHRFGVEQRSKLLALGTHEVIPHLLTMTATPIPRTLALTIYGDLEISKIDLLEKSRKNIKTWIVSEGKRDDAFKWIAKQNLPTFVICPLIEESEHETLESVKAAEAEFVRLKDSYFKELKVGLLHGRMKSSEKLKEIEKFRNGQIKILVATPVIEVGIDVPDASVIVIESAERYGLASLHQLRGRVGRAGQQAYCLVFTSKRGSTARLKNLEKYNSGIKLAEIDMQMRGQGDLYGTMQHGFTNFKVADFNDLGLLEGAKKDASSFLPKLESYPMLKDKLSTKTSELVSQN